LDDGSLQVHRACVESATDTGDAVQVRLSDGQTITAQSVVNCTGPANDVRRSADPLLMHLLDAGLARPGRLGLGLATDRAGRVLGRDPGAKAIWTLGPLRQGELWESTAIPEIRTQAAALATAVLAELPEPDVRRRPRDPYGLPLTADPAAAEAYVEGLGRILRVQSGAEWFLAAAVGADPDFALGHATLALLGVEWGADIDVPAALDAAHRAADRADEREQRFIEAVTARVQHPGTESAATLIAYLHAYPEDALAASIAVPTIAFGGATEVPAEAWAIVEGLAPVYRDDWWYRSLLAFTRQEQERYEESAHLADQALAAEPGSGHAVHARTHVYYETGDHAAGLAWLDGWIRSCGRAASHRAHFSWHAALHELALGDDQAAARRYAAQLAPPAVRGVRALVDSASLLWRGYAMGAWQPDGVRPVLDSVPVDLLSEPATPFVALHAAVALAAAGDCRGLSRLRRYAATRPEPAFSQTVAPLVDALVHLAHDDPDRATDELVALEGVDRLGGSAAQREIVEETLLFSAVRAERFDLAREILTRRLDRRASPRDGRRLRELSPQGARRG
jgi:tetratricopeptide (TPR) repeat protein